MKMFGNFQALSLLNQFHSPGERKHAKQCGIQVTRIVMTLDSTEFTSQFTPITKLADGWDFTTHRWTFWSSILYK